MVILAASWFAADTHSVQAQTTNVLITTSTMWRYNQTGTNLGTAWQAPGYNDTVAGWEGPGLPLFGFETDEGQYNNLGVTFNTHFPDPQVAGNFRTNYYFRTHFTMPNYSAGVLAATTLVTTNWYDDGVVYYLNGSELLRTNMPAGTITATTFANPQAPSEPIQRVISIIPTNLLAGDNVLAVELHQVSIGSSDEVFGMVMAAITPTPLSITSQPTSRTNVVAETNATFSVTVSGTTPYSYHWFSNSVLIAGATSASYTAPTPFPNVVNYYVSISNLVGSVVTSDTVTLTIIPDTFPPTLLSATAGPPPPTRGSNQVDVIFSESMDNSPTSSGDLNSVLFTNHYVISILGTTNTIPVTQAQANGSLVRLTTPTNFIYGTNYVLCVTGVADKHTNVIAANSCIGIGVVRTNLPPAATPLTNIFPMDQIWTYSEPDHDIGTSWRSNDFTGDLDFSCPDNNCWASGRSVFYFEQNVTPCPGSSLQGGPLDPVLTFYFRTRFVAPSNTLPSGVFYVTNFIDDGVIMYLNGTEIFRRNMPGGPVAVTTPSSSQAAAACINTLISVTNLMMPPPATNVFCAELHESGNGINDRDIYFGLSLSYTNTPAYTPYFTNISAIPPRISIAQQGATSTNVITWTTNVGGYFWGLNTATNLGANAAWSALTNSNGAPVSSPYTNRMIGNRYFRLRAK